MNKKSISGLLVVAATMVSAVSSASADYHQCTPARVGFVGNRVHVQCAESLKLGSLAIWWFALPVTDSLGTSRFLDLAERALAAKKPMLVGYMPGDTSGAAFDCQASDCRKLVSFEMLR